VAGGLGIAGVRMLADEALRDGRRVTLLFGAASAREVYPSTLLPDEVEYVVATDDGSLGHHGYVTDLIPEYEAWADQAFAAAGGDARGPGRLAAGRRDRPGVASWDASGRRQTDPVVAGGRRRRSPGLDEQNMGCAVGRVLAAWS
jgi:hypothetical protein